MQRFARLVTILLVSVPVLARAQEVDSSAVRELDPVVITGSRIEVARRNAPLTISTISREEIQQSGESNLLPVLSSRVPGLFVTERGVTGFGVANGAAGQITIRGVGANPNTQVLVLIDGHPQFMGLMGHPLADTYVASDAERVEVVRGPAAILYGTGAMAGVINVITRRPQREGISADARLSYGSYDTRKYSAGVGYNTGRFDVYGSINHDQTDGHRAFSDFDITSGYTKMGLDIGSGLRLAADGGLSSYESLDPGPTSNPSTTDRPVDILRGRASVALFNNFSRTEGAARVYYSYGDHEIYDGFQSTDYNLGLMLYQGIRILPGGTLTLGLDHKRFGGSAENVLGKRDFGSHSVTETAGYALLQQTIASRLIVNGGLRLEDNSLYGAEWVPQVGVSYHPARATTLKASVAKGFRSPTIRELYLFPAPNPDLEPERMWNTEAGVLQQFGPASLELTVFRSKGSNLIQVTGQPPRLQSVNSGEFENRGVEVLATLQASRELRLTTSYSYLHTDRVLVAAPEHQVFGEAEYRLKAFTITGQVQRIAGLYTSPQGGKRENYTLVNAGVSYRPVPHLNVFVRAENLLDQEYQINFDYPMPGTTFFTGIAFRY